jgi:hypothetical protein
MEEENVIDGFADISSALSNGVLIMTNTSASPDFRV